MRPVLAARAAERAVAAHLRDGEWPLARGFAIGGVEIGNRVVQAPLAGIANWAFRRQSRRHGAGLAVSEMVAGFGVHHGNRRTLDMLRTVPDEHPVSVQLFGAEPDVMAEAAAAAEAAGADLIDVNMGCPVPKICKTGAGAALLDDLDRAAAIVGAMTRAVDVPVTVKMRRGLTERSGDPTEAARRLEAAGAAALFLHPRAAVERYEGTADHDVTARVAAAVAIPVVASGDLTTPERARRVLEESGCAAVAIGRAVLGDPWAFRRIATGADSPHPGPVEAAGELVRFAEDAREALGQHRATHYLRKFYPWYLAPRGVPRAEVEELVMAPDLETALARLGALARASAAA
jgi:nifR3 family TIM-barrel protein